MNKKFILKLIIVYLICIAIYPTIYGALVGFSMFIGPNNHLEKQMREEWMKNPKSTKQSIAAFKKLQDDIKHKPSSEKLKMIFKNKDVKNLINNLNWFFMACFSSGLAFLILGIIIGIFLRKWIYI